MADDPLRIEREQMRARRRVPRRLTIIFDLPEAPMGDEAGAVVTQHLPFADAAADRGLLGEVVRSLVQVDRH